MFLILEGEDAVFLERVVALVREGNETAILYRDGSVRATGFTPLTLAARTERLMRAGRKEWRDLRRGLEEAPAPEEAPPSEA
jgi:hypothetical protein